MQKLSTILIALLLAVFCIGTQAGSSHDGKWYQIELIVFSHITPQGLHSEQWSWTSPFYMPKSRMITLNTNSDFSRAATMIPYVVLPDNDFIMKREQARISKQAGYQILLHLAWRQPIRSPRYAQPIHIFGGNVYNVSGKVIATDFDGRLPYNSGIIWQVNGMITVSVRRYLDLHLNLLFAKPTSELSSGFRNNATDNIQGRFAYFRLLQSRRMRTKELNYIGHPLYGVLVKVKPLEYEKSS